MKRKRKIQLAIGLGIVIVITGLEIWSVWFGSRNPQTGFRRLASIINHSILKKESVPDIIFLGDSIMAREDWDGLLGVDNIMNAGISGNTTDDVLARLDHLLALKPKKIFLMVGVNDLSKGKDVSYILNNYETIVEKIKAESPDTAIYVESILPIDNQLSPIGKIDSQKIVELNAGLRSLAEEEREIFINLYPSFVSSDNKMDVRYASDGVHPNANGYELMENLLIPYIK